MFGSPFYISLLRTTIVATTMVALFLILDKPKISIRYSILFHIIVCSVPLVIVNIWYIYDAKNFFQYVMLVSFALTSICCIILSRDKLSVIFYNLSIQFFVSIMLIFICTGIAIHFFNSNPWVDIILRILLLTGLITFYTKNLRAVFRAIVDDMSIGLGYFGISFMCVTIVLYIFLTQPIIVFKRSILEQFLAVGITGMVVLMHIMTSSYLFTIRREKIAQSESELVRMNNHLLQRQLETLEESVEDVRRIRHEVWHHNLTIAEYIKNGQTEELLCYIDRQNKEAEKDKAVKLCNNVAANNILAAYERKARQNNIDVHFDISIEKNICIKDIDLVAILANLMENAIQGCINSKVASQKIDIYIRRKASKMVIESCNTCDADASFENELIRLKISEGVGISSILYAAENYNGETDFYNDNGIFICRVLLNIPSVNQ